MAPRPEATTQWVAATGITKEALAITVAEPMAPAILPTAVTARVVTDDARRANLPPVA